MNKEPSLKEKIVLFLKEKHPRWIISGEIEVFGSSQGRMYSNAKRRVQELAQAGKIERRINNGYAEFRWKSEEVYKPEFLENQKKLTQKLI